MEKQNLYSVVDIVAQQASPPFAAVNDAVAKRQFFQLLKDAYDTEDYELHEVGTYSMATGQITSDGGSRIVETKTEVIYKNVSLKSEVKAI